MMLGQKMQYLGIYVNVNVNFPNANFSCEEWCYADDVGYGIIVLLS